MVVAFCHCWITYISMVAESSTFSSSSLHGNKSSFPTRKRIPRRHRFGRFSSAETSAVGAGAPAFAQPLLALGARGDRIKAQ